MKTAAQGILPSTISKTDCPRRKPYRALVAWVDPYQLQSSGSQNTPQMRLMWRQSSPAHKQLLFWCLSLVKEHSRRSASLFHGVVVCPTARRLYHVPSVEYIYSRFSSPQSSTFFLPCFCRAPGSHWGPLHFTVVASILNVLNVVPCYQHPSYEFTARSSLKRSK